MWAIECVCVVHAEGYDWRDYSNKHFAIKVHNLVIIVWELLLPLIIP